MKKVGAATFPIILFAFAGIPCAPALADRNIAPEREAAVIQGIDKAQADREEKLAGYTVTEHYLIANSRFGAPAETVVETTYIKGAGKSYRVVSRAGPSILQSLVIDRVLAEEKVLSQGQERKAALVTSRNYRMNLAGRETVDGRACDVVTLNPVGKAPHLLRGKAWFDAGTHRLVRIEGKAISSPSFLSGRPDIDREYVEIQGFSLARRSHAISSSLILGRTELTIEYTGYRVAGE